LTRIVLTWSTVGGLGSGLVVESDGTIGSATGAVLSVDDAGLDGGAGSGNRACSVTLVGQWSCDLAGIAPVFRNQHLRPSIWRQEYQPLLGSPGALRQSIAQAEELARQQQRNIIMTTIFMTTPVELL
jgi:hypothetical protein